MKQYQQEWRVVYFFPLTSSLVSIVPDWGKVNKRSSSGGTSITINEAFSGCHIVNKHEYYPFIGAHELWWESRADQRGESRACIVRTLASCMEESRTCKVMSCRRIPGNYIQPDPRPPARAVRKVARGARVILPLQLDVQRLRNVFCRSHLCGK